MFCWTVLFYNVHIVSKMSEAFFVMAKAKCEVLFHQMSLKLKFETIQGKVQKI